MHPDDYISDDTTQDHNAGANRSFGQGTNLCRVLRSRDMRCVYTSGAVISLLQGRSANHSLILLSANFVLSFRPYLGYCNVTFFITRPSVNSRFLYFQLPGTYNMQRGHYYLV